MRIGLFVIALLFSGQLFGQTYTMSDRTVSDCTGTLTDSDNGSIVGNYDHNENYTFSICIPGASSISLVFTSFCTEQDFDYIRFFDGPDTMSTQIGGSFSGIIGPNIVVSTGGCLTVNFISDANVTCTGWSANWTVQMSQPPAPIINPIFGVTCFADSLTMSLVDSIPCDSVYNSAFWITGTQGHTTVQATPISCINGKTKDVFIRFNPIISFSGGYTLNFRLSFTDACDSVWTSVSRRSFSVTDCPLNVILSADPNPVCEDSCVTLEARATGGDQANYSYQWSPALPNQRSHTICPTASIVYSVTVSDGGTSVPAQTSIQINVLPKPAIVGGNRTVCQSDPQFNLVGNPVGGTWSGRGFLDTLTGLYNPASTGGIRDTVIYTGPNGCKSQIFIDITPIQPGPPLPVCLGEPPFQLTGFSPAGGTWSGVGVNTTGFFTPDTVGIYLLTYTLPNGCLAERRIFVDTIQFPPIDTVCASQDPFVPIAKPPFGIWSGPGMGSDGLFDPRDANPGSNILTYEIRGCTDSTEIFLKDIWAGWNQSSCPNEAPFLFYPNARPAGGYWQGGGIIDTTTGLYDPGVLANRTWDIVTYHFDGCIDTAIMFVRQTTILNQNLIKFCTTDDSLELDWTSVMRTPSGGLWSGPGISNTSRWESHFNPANAGPGVHQLIYTANTCSDTTYFEVYPIADGHDTITCVQASPFDLFATPPGGQWFGQGISNRTNGTFEPALVGYGQHLVRYISPDGCLDTVEVFVDTLVTPMIAGIEQTYCYQDTTIFPGLTPTGGVLTINGNVATSFNPAQAGAGTHQIIYTIGSGECKESVTIFVSVSPTLDINVPFILDTICFGEAIELTVTANGGASLGNYLFGWDNGLGFGSSKFVSPQFNTRYTVTVDDGCSDPKSISIQIIVEREIVPSYAFGPLVCFYDTTFAVITAQPGNDFGYIWQTDPPTAGNRIYGTPKLYSVSITNFETGCSILDTIDIPGYDVIQANFSFNPNEPCVTSYKPVVTFLDLSVGGEIGWWDLGDGSQVPFEAGVNPEHLFKESGTYTVKQIIQDAGGCESEYELDICVKYIGHLHAPNAFTPNFDGKNEFFRLVGVNVTEFNLKIYNRFGQRLFESPNIEDGWDGTVNGKLVDAGVYTWVVEYQTLEEPGKTLVQKGFVTVIF